MLHSVTGFLSSEEVPPSNRQDATSSTTEVPIAQLHRRLRKVMRSEELLFVLREPGALRIPLDQKEAQILLGTNAATYERLCKVGHLPTSLIGRDYFEPLLQHHTFWDLQRCSLSIAHSIRTYPQMQMLDSFLDAIAYLVEASQCTLHTLFATIEAARTLVASLVQSRSTESDKLVAHRSEGFSIAVEVFSDLACYGQYCRRRMRNELWPDARSPESLAVHFQDRRQV